MSPLRCRSLTVDVPGRRLLSDVTLEVRGGQSVAITGPSGSGKSTLLNVVAGIMSAASGVVEINGREIGSLGSDERARFRLRNIGIVFQFGELLPEFTAQENVALPLRFGGMPHLEALARAADVLKDVRLGDLIDAHPDQLSGGERQRVGVARALAGKPAVVLADEPTGSLDRDNADSIARLLIEKVGETQAALLLATHDPRVAERCDQVFELRAGSLASADPTAC